MTFKEERGVCVVPARNGSKRLPRKNVRRLAGRPMMGWIIDAAVDSGVFDHVYVSTESREIASTASLLGAEVPYIRGHPVNGEVGTWFGAFRIPNLVPRSLVNIVGCSSRGRGNCGKLRADIELGQQARDTEFSKRCANGGKTTASTCQFSSRTSCFSTVCIVRQFPRPAFDWRHLPIYRMNLYSSDPT